MTFYSQIILDAVKADGDTTRDYQAERDEITRGLVKDVRHYVAQIEEVDKAIADFLPRFECTLNTILGVSDTTVAKLLSEIGDIRRFPNADKLANFAGIAPVNFSSAGKGDDKPSKQGNRRRDAFYNDCMYTIVLFELYGKRGDRLYSSITTRYYRKRVVA
ncbi:MAG: IS110 family transposase [Lachnospiraceae bacterium]|nr:IS110 family transposase [Lachnospiraceae bacterium]